jgi:glutamate-1-semialdehyde 2,1-aminomutase
MKNLYKTAQKYIPSGVNSPVRAFRAVGGDPVFVARGKGPYFWDEGGKRYLDFCCSWGPLLFGHAPAGLIGVLRQAVPKGTSFGAATSGEIKLARAIQGFFPSMEKIRLVSSGTEAVMSAVRLARGFTGRKKILKLDGGYHGHADSLLVKAGSGVATFGIPDSAGVPEELARLTLSIPFNDLPALETVLKKEGLQIAAFILEPVPANMGVVLPEPGYLQQVRKLTRKYGILLIFDEVITGFRVSPGGAQEYYGIRPDLTCFGKILGGGLPLAAFGGRTDIMDYLAPGGPVYQAGTLSGNPVAVAAALWMLGEIRKKSPAGKKKSAGIKSLDAVASDFYCRLDEAIRKNRWPVQLNRIGSMFTFFFSTHPVTDYASAKRSDTQRYARFFHACLKAGIYLAPAQFEANFISFAHSGTLLRRTAGLLCGRIFPALFKS